jgi:broad specificity phosphatase PhoE
MTSLLLIRHAVTDMAGRFCGHSDPELNGRGQQQSAGLMEALSAHNIRRVYTSDLRRARQTAAAIAKHFAIELYERPGLREIYFGRWEGLSWDEIETEDPVLAKSWAKEYPDSTAPGGESFLRFACQPRDFLLAGGNGEISDCCNHPRRIYPDRTNPPLRNVRERSLESHEGIWIDRRARHE